MLGRRHLRRGAALPQGRPLGAPRRAAPGDPQRTAADAAALFQCGGLHQLSGQRGAPLQAPGRGGAGRRGRHRPVPRLRFAQLGGQHARGDGRRARDGCAVRGGAVLHRRPHQGGATEVRPQVLREHGQELERAGAHIIAIKDMAGICHPRAVRLLVRRCATKWGCRCTSIPTTPAASRPPACWPRWTRASMRWMARSTP